MKRPGRRNLRIAIHHYGVISEVAKHFDVPRQTIYNWLDYYDMRGEVTAARHQMREVAADVVYARLMAEDAEKAWDAAQFVLRHLRNDGELLVLSPEVIAGLRRMGIPVSEAVRQFEELVLASSMEDALSG